MFSCDRCEKKYGHIHKLHHHKRWGCKGHPPETCMLSSPRRAGSSNCYTLPPTPEKGEADVEVGNRQKEGEDKTDEVAAWDEVSVIEQGDRGIVCGEVEKPDSDEAENLDCDEVENLDLDSNEVEKLDSGEVEKLDRDEVKEV